MKFKLFTALALISFVGMVHASEPAKFEPMSESTVSKCMTLHQYNSIAQNSNTYANVKRAEEYMQMSFTTKQIEAYQKLISDWNTDINIKSTYKGLIGPDVHGRSLTPAMMMAACIKAM